MLFLYAATSLQAQPPQLLNYQGKLVRDGTPTTGTFTMIFSIYSDSTSGVRLWTEIRDVAVTAGVFNVLLGSITTFQDTLFANVGHRYLGVKVGNDSEMRPRFRLTSVAYAIKAVSPRVAIGSFTQVAAGIRAITGLGFKPQIVKFNVIQPRAGSPPSFSASGSWGAMTEKSQYAIELYAGTGAVRSLVFTDRVIHSSAADRTDPQVHASFVSMDSDGFTIRFFITDTAAIIVWEAWE
jgi:hypothetical protein